MILFLPLKDNKNKRTPLQKLRSSSLRVEMFTRYILLLFIIKSCFTETSSQALPGCQERCGSVTLPYPFGIGQNCSAHDTYSITCNTSFNPPRPFITSITLEALEISLEGTLRVNSPLLNTCNGSKAYTIIDFRNTPFTYSPTATRFTAMGCDNLALIRGRTGVLGGCISLCNISVPGRTCYGVLCCQTNIPPSLEYIDASVDSIPSANDSANDQNGCRYAFMVDVDWFGNLTNIFEVQSMPSVPAVLDWRLSWNCRAFAPSGLLTYPSICGSNAFCSNQGVCSCMQGYQGNPYLHSSAGMPIYHRDIKSTNILLDEKFRAKVADFGTSRTLAVDQTHLTTKVQGTFGYLDPEYFQSSQFTEKSDVYSFGVVLVELLSGEKPIASFRVSETRSLAAYFLAAMEENRLYEIVDPRVKTEGEEGQIRRFADLANRCLNLDGRKRPRMKEVAIELELIRTSNEAPAATEITGIESGQIRVSSSSDSHPLLL